MSLFRKLWKGKMSDQPRTEPGPAEASSHLQIVLTNGMIVDMPIGFSNGEAFVICLRLIAHDGFLATGAASIPLDKIVMMRRYNPANPLPGDTVAAGGNVVTLRPA